MRVIPVVFSCGLVAAERIVVLSLVKGTSVAGERDRLCRLAFPFGGSAAHVVCQRLARERAGQMCANFFPRALRRRLMGNACAVLWP